jgi:hypothetical protein
MAERTEDVQAHWTRPGVLARIDAALTELRHDPQNLTPEILATVEHLHSGGLATTRDQAKRIAVTEDSRVLEPEGVIATDPIAYGRPTGGQQYWLWGPKGAAYRNRLPFGIVQIVEKHGFIWGGMGTLRHHALRVRAGTSLNPRRTSVKTWPHIGPFT